MSRVKTFKTTLKFRVHFSSFLANHWNKNLLIVIHFEKTIMMCQKKECKRIFEIIFSYHTYVQNEKRGLVVNTEMYFQIQNYLYSSVNCTLDRCLQKKKNISPWLSLFLWCCLFIKWKLLSPSLCPLLLLFDTEILSF